MTEEERINDEMIRDLFKDTEIKEAPEGLNERIMEEVRKTKPERNSFPGSIRPAWILLFSAVILLPFFLKLIPEALNKYNSSGQSLFDISARNLNFVFMVIIAAALLLIADQLIKLSILSN